MDKNQAKKAAAKGAKKGKFEDLSLSTKLMPQSHYFLTLADPFNKHGEKIPDSVSFPSSTFTLVNRRVMSLTSDGFGAVCYGLNGNASNITGSLVPVNWIAGSVFALSDKMPLGMMSTGVGTGDVNNLFSTSTTPGAHTKTINHTAWQDGIGVPTIYDKVRLVSAGVSCDYLGTMLNSKGRITAVSCPRNTYRPVIGGASTGAITLDSLQNQVDVKVLPINRMKSAMLTYHPIDTVSFGYTDLNLDMDNSNIAIQDGEQSKLLGGELFFVIDGAEGGAAVQLTEVFNYEGIPSQGSLNIVQPTLSRSDPIELSMAMNEIQEVPKTYAGDAPVQNLQKGNTQVTPHQAPKGGSMQTTEAVREEEEEETFFEKILGGGLELASSFAPGIVGKALPLAKEAISSLL